MQAAQLQATLAKINKRFGAGTVSSFGQRTTFPDMCALPVAALADYYSTIGMPCPSSLGTWEKFSTGVLTLDNVLGGGIPRGRIIEIFGPESSGKTSLALCIMAEAQKKGHYVAMIDAEHAFDEVYASALGLDCKSAALTISKPETGEDSLEIVDEFCRSGTMGVILVDSVSALIPRNEMDRDMGDPQIGSQARLMSNSLKRISQSAARSNTTVIFVNQLRMKIGVIYGNPETTSGGMALKYYASQRIDVRKKQHLDGEKDGPANGVRIKAKVVKNKVGPPAGVVLFDIIYAKGVDRTGCLVDAAVAVKAIERRGSHCFFTTDGIEVKLGNGRDKTITFLDEKANGKVRAAVEAATKERLVPGHGLPEVPNDSQAPSDSQVPDDD